MGNFAAVRRIEVTSWDRRSAVRAATISALAFLIVCLMTAATDEGGLGVGVRLGRSLPFSPVCAAFGTWLALSRRRTRGELLALEGLGRSPQLNALGAVIGGAAIAVSASFFVAVVPFVDVAGFYPDSASASAHSESIRFEGGGFVDHRRGLRFGSDGSFEKVAEPASLPNTQAITPRSRRGAAAVAIALAGVALPFLIASLRRAIRSRVIAALVILVPLTVLLFHAVAAQKAAAFVVVLPPLGLLMLATWSYRSWAWETEAPPP